MWGAGGTAANPGGSGTANWGNWFNLFRDPSPRSFTDPLGADGFYEVFSGYVLDWTPPPAAGPYDHTSYTGFGDLNMVITAEAVPEPGTLSLLALGGVALMALRRRRA
jgi:hypothetical protein